MRLILTRHAKSSWDDPAQEDFDRTLNARGRAAAQAMGRALKAQNCVPDQALVSSAQRTRETWAIMAEAMGVNPLEARFEPALYLASEDVLLKHLRRATGQAVMLIAHNPGIGYFAGALAKSRPAHPDFARFPTCATTIYDIAADRWDNVKPGQNPVAQFIVPGDLPAN